MINNRVKCPCCKENIPGVERDGAVIKVRNGRVEIQYMGTGSLTCPCGAKVVTEAGTVRLWSPPNSKPREVAEVISIEVMKGTPSNAEARQ